MQQPIIFLSHSLIIYVFSKYTPKIPNLLEATLLNAKVSSTEAPTSNEF